MSVTKEMRLHWEKRVPGLSGKFTHWWLEGDGGLIIVTNDLVELIDKTSEHYSQSLKIYVSRAYHNEAGDCVKDRKMQVLISDYEDDKICKRFKG